MLHLICIGGHLEQIHKTPLILTPDKKINK
jgi:hypothetical protein